MGKDKEYNARMEGMSKAYDIAKEQGIEALFQEIKRRGYFMIDARMSQKEYTEMTEKVCTVIYNNILTCSAYALNQEFGFGEDRLKRWKNAFEKVTDDSFDWNYQSKQYVTMADYAVEMNRKYKLGINVDLVSANEDSFQERRERQEAYKKEYVKGIINTLKLNGYDEAGEFLEGKL